MASRTRRRRLEVFSMSFLDCICCGFGAVVLIYMIIAAQTGARRAQKSVDMSAEVKLLEEEVIDGYKNLAVLRNTLNKTDQEKAAAAGNNAAATKVPAKKAPPKKKPVPRATKEAAE